MNLNKTPSPNFNERPSAIDAIIIHYTDMVSAEAALAWLINPSSQVSAHYLIDEEGKICQMVDEEHRAWHAGESYWQGRGNLNDCSIGIELANPGHSHGYTPFPEAQIASLIELCLDIKERWNIPSYRILGHSDIAPQRKQDPGHLFPWKQLATEGLGMWPSSEQVFNRHCEPSKKASQSRKPQKDWIATAPSGPRNDDDAGKLMEVLSQLGYDITSPSHTLLAFQRHFQTHKIDGMADQETYALLQGLLKSQEMLI